MVFTDWLGTEFREGVGEIKKKEGEGKGGGGGEKVLDGEKVEKDSVYVVFSKLETAG